MFKFFLENNYPPFSDIKNKLWYHGTETGVLYGSIAKDDIIQEGPGWYFTNSMKDAMIYGDNILVCKINYKNLVPNRVNLSIIRKLILSSPDYEARLRDFDEEPAKAIQMALQSYAGQQKASQAYQAICGDFYGNKYKQYLSVLSKFFDADMVKRDSETRHLIVYNPEIIEVVDKFKI